MVHIPVTDIKANASSPTVKVE